MTAIYTTTHKGKTATRTSKGHTAQQYFFAVWSEGGCEAYASRRDLAEARKREFESSGWENITIEPVSCEIKLTKKQRAFVAGQAAKPTFPAVNSQGRVLQVTVPE